MIPTLFILSWIVFLAVRFIPGDIVDIIADSMWWEHGNQCQWTGRLFGGCWDWTCPSTCSMDAG